MYMALRTLKVATSSMNSASIFAPDPWSLQNLINC